MERQVEARWKGGRTKVLAGGNGGKRTDGTTGGWADARLNEPVPLDDSTEEMAVSGKRTKAHLRVNEE
ncbi:MAG: hypothetical protein Q4B54_07375 [Coriobacteriales bacterium]|nr:hypothetical protein [Coriobacteriales bacterium]